MSGREVPKLSSVERRRALRLGYVNGALWAIGNSLTTGTLIVYLALDLGASGVSISVVAAIPSLVGVLRLASPVLIDWCGTTKRTCLTTSLASYLILLGLPPVALAQGWLAEGNRLPALIGLLCVHQLLEYIGGVALWAWLADLVPSRMRGRYFARRQVWQLGVMIPTLLTSGWFADHWRTNHPSHALVGYAIPTGIGALFLLASLIPLVRMPATDRARPQRTRGTWRSLLAPFGDGRFQRLVMFGCWFSFFNGVTQAPQLIYPKEVLLLGVADLAWMYTVMRLGQMVLSLPVGWFSDRFGNRPTLVVSQLLVATGPLFFLWATPERPWILYGAWLVWSAYVGLNICLPNLMLKLSPGGGNASYIALYFAVTSICYAASSVAGGYFFDLLRSQSSGFHVGPFDFDLYEYMFCFGWVTRTLGVVLLVLIVEPGAWRWPAIVRFLLSRLRR